MDLNYEKLQVEMMIDLMIKETVDGCSYKRY